MAKTLAFLTLLATIATGAAAANVLPNYTRGNYEVTPFISDRARAEVVNWFDPGPAAPQNDEDYAFFANVVRFGFRLRHSLWGMHLEGQEVELVGLPDDAAKLGPGAAYFANTRDRDQRELNLRQAFITFPRLLMSGLALKGGRFIYNDGMETPAADPSLAWIKKMRISQRLIGGFDYTHVGRSIDGGILSLDLGPARAVIMGGLPTAGGFEISGNRHMDDIYLVYSALTVTEPPWLPRSDMRLFHLFYRDSRDLVATDNRSAAARAADNADIQIHTVGANFTKLARLGPGDIDSMVWAAGQFGDWESLDHSAYAVAGETGYRLVDRPWKPWVRFGFFQSSGDNDPADSKHETFFQVLPTARLYALTPFFNLMNNRDVFAQLILKPLASLIVRLDYHYLEVTEGNDLLYAGGGATQADAIFGYAGFPARGDEAVAHFTDVTVIYDMNPHLRFWLYYGRAFGRAVIENQFPAGNNLNYAYLETTLRF